MPISDSIHDDGRERPFQASNIQKSIISNPTNSDLRHIAPMVARKLKPHDAVPPRFREVCNFRNYRLRDQNPSQYDKNFYKARKKLKITLSYIQAFDGMDPGCILEFLDDYVTACDQNYVSEGIAVILMVDYMRGAAKQDLLNQMVKFDDPVTSFKRRPFFFEVVQHLLITYASGHVLRVADVKINSLTQQPTQSAVNFHAAILRMTRRYGSAYPFEEIIEIFLRGVDNKLVSVHSEWQNLSRAASANATSESSRLIRYQEAFRELLSYADGHRYWETTSAQTNSKYKKGDRLNDLQPILHHSHNSHGTYISAVCTTTPPAKFPSSSNTVVRPYDYKYPLCPTPPPVPTPAGKVPLTDDEIRLVNGGDKCHLCLTSKASAPPPNPDDDDPVLPPHVTTGCVLIAGSPSLYWLVRLRHRWLINRFSNRQLQISKSAMPTNTSGHTGH